MSSVTASKIERHDQCAQKKCIFFITFFCLFVGPLSRVRPRNGILGLVLVVVLVLPLRSEFIGEL